MKTRMLLACLILILGFMPAISVANQILNDDSVNYAEEVVDPNDPNAVLEYPE